MVSMYHICIYGLQHVMKYHTAIKWAYGGGGGANTKVPDMYGVGGVFSGPKTQK